LVFLLAVHFFGGLRLMAFELLTWTKDQKTWAAASVAFAFMVAGGFLLRAI
jgi:fumarate reductase subunit D